MKTLLKLLLAGLSIFLIKAALTTFIPAPSALSDDYVYAKTAQSLHESFTFSTHNTLFYQYPPLYPAALSISYLFKDMRVVYLLMKIINALISTMIIFPTYLLSREFMHEKRALVTAILVSLLPSNFAFSGYIMAENLFYPIFLFAIYLIYKAFTEKSYWWDFFTGITIGLAFLTRTLGIVLIPIAFLSWIIKMFLQKNRFSDELKKRAVLAAAFLLVAVPWILRNAAKNGLSVNSSLGDYPRQVVEGKTTDIGILLLSNASWIFMHVGYMALASGILFFILSIFCIKKMKTRGEKLLVLIIIYISSIISVVLLTSYYNSHSDLGYAINYKTFTPWLTGRMMGRYVDYVLPLIIIMGVIGFSIYEATKNKSRSLVKYMVYTAPFIAFSTQVVFFPLFPVNNISLVHFGVVKYLLDYLTGTINDVSTIVFMIFLLLIFGFMYCIAILSHLNKIKLKTILAGFTLLFIMIGMLGFAVNYYNSSQYWRKSDQMQMGLWINDNIKEKSVFLIDKRYEGKIEKNNDNLYEQFSDGSFASTIDFWMNHKVIIGELGDLKDADYVITKEEMDFKLIKNIGAIKLYETRK